MEWNAHSVLIVATNFSVKFRRKVSVYNDNKNKVGGCLFSLLRKNQMYGLSQLSQKLFKWKPQRSSLQTSKFAFIAGSFLFCFFFSLCLVVLRLEVHWVSCKSRISELWNFPIRSGEGLTLKMSTSLSLYFRNSFYIKFLIYCLSRKKDLFRLAPFWERDERYSFFETCHPILVRILRLCRQEQRSSLLSSLFHCTFYYKLSQRQRATFWQI